MTCVTDFGPPEVGLRNAAIADVTYWIGITFGYIQTADREQRAGTVRIESDTGTAIEPAVKSPLIRFAVREKLTMAWSGINDSEDETTLLNKNSKPRYLILATGIATWIGLCACAGGRSTIPSDSCPIPAVGVSEYMIGTGDSLQIVVWRSVELSATVPVRPDGKITTPLIDDMQASGKTPSQLAADMEEVLAEYLRSPEISVIVSAQGSANQVQVVGQVLTPQAISYRDNLRVLDVIVAVGGLTDFAAGNRTNLVRSVDGTQVECRVRVKDIMAGKLSENIKVYPGDVIVVPETRF